MSNDNNQPPKKSKRDLLIEKQIQANKKLVEGGNVQHVKPQSVKRKVATKIADDKKPAPEKPSGASSNSNTKYKTDWSKLDYKGPQNALAQSKSSDMSVEDHLTRSLMNTFGGVANVAVLSTSSNMQQAQQNLKQSLKASAMERKNLSAPGTRAVNTQPLTKAERRSKDQAEWYTKQLKNFEDRNKGGIGTWANGWLSAGALVGTKGVLDAITWSGSSLGAALDVADAMRTISLPDVYDLKDMKTTTKELANIGMKVSMNMLGNTVGRSTGTKDVWDNLTNRVYESNKKSFEQERLKTKKAAEIATAKGTRESDTKNFYDKYALARGLNFNVGVVNSIGDFIDDKIFRDKDSTGNWLSNLSDKQREVDTAEFNSGVEAFDLEKKKIEFGKASTDLNSKIQVLNDLAKKGALDAAGQKDLESLQQELYKVKNDIFSRQRGTSMMSQKFTDAKGSMFQRFADLGLDSFQDVNDLADFNNMYMSNVSQGAGIIVASMATGGAFRGVGALAQGTKVVGGAKLGNIASKISNNSGVANAALKAEGLASDVLGKVSKTGLGQGLTNIANKTGYIAKTPVENFSNFTKNFMQKPTFVKGLEITKNQMKNAPQVYASSYSESRMIGTDVYNTIVKDGIESATGVTKEEFYEQFTPENEEAGFTSLEIEKMNKAYDEEVVKKFMNQKPSEYMKIIDKANQASDLAVNINMAPSLVTNSLFFNNWLKASKPVTRLSGISKYNFMRNNAITHGMYKTVKKQANTVVTEGFLEEAGINLIAQKKAEALGKGGFYDMMDYYNDIGSEEYMDNLVAGAFSSGGQNLVMSIPTMRSEFKEDQMYAKAYKDLKELSKYTNKDEFGKFVSLNLDANNQQVILGKQIEYSDKKKDLKQKLKESKPRSSERKEIKKQIEDLDRDFEQENNKLILTKINNSLATGTTDKLIKVLEDRKAAENVDPKEVAQIDNILSTVKNLEQDFNNHHDKANISDILANRYTQHYNTSILNQAKAELSNLESGLDGVIKEFVDISNIFNQNLNPETGVLNLDQYVQQKKQSILDTKEKINQGDDLGNADFRKVTELRKVIAEQEKALAENNKNFKDLINEDKQEEVRNTKQYRKEVTRLHSVYGNDVEKLNSALDQLDKQNKDILPSEVRAAVRNEVDIINDNLKTLSKLQEEAEQQEKDLQEKAKLEAEKEVVNKKVADTVERIETDGPVTAESAEVEKELKQEGLIPENLESESNLEAYKQELAELDFIEGQDVLTAEQEARQRELRIILNDNQTRSELKNLLGNNQVDSDTASNVLAEEVENNEVPEKTTEDEVYEEMYDAEDGTGDFSEVGDDYIEDYEEGGYNEDYIDPNSTPEDYIDYDVDDFSLNDVNYSVEVIEDNDELSQKYEDYVRGLITQAAYKLGKEVSDITAEDVVNHAMHAAGKDLVEHAWDIIKLGYMRNRPDSVVDFDGLYSKYFTDGRTFLTELVNEAVVNPADKFENKVDPTQGQTNVPGQVVKFDENNKPVAPKPKAQSIRGLVVEPDNQVGKDTTVKSESRGEGKDDRNFNFNHQFLTHTFLNNPLYNFFKPDGTFDDESYPGMSLSALFDPSNFEEEGSDKLTMTVRMPTQEEMDTLPVRIPVSRAKRDEAGNIMKDSKGRTIMETVARTKNKETGKRYTIKDYAEVRGSDPSQSPTVYNGTMPLVIEYKGKPVMMLSNMQETHMRSPSFWNYPDGLTDAQKATLRSYNYYLNKELRDQVFNNGGKPVTIKVGARAINQNTKHAAAKKLKDLGDKLVLAKFNPRSDGAKFTDLQGNPIEVTNLDLSNFSRGNSTVLLRQDGVDPTGKPKFAAFELPRNKTNNFQTVSSALAAIKTYLTRDYHGDKGAKNLESFHASVFENSNKLDLKDTRGLREYLKGLYKESYFATLMEKESYTHADGTKYTSAEKKAYIKTKMVDFMNSPENRALPGQVTYAIVDYKIVAVKKNDQSKGEYLSEKDVMVIDPSDIRKPEHINGELKDLMDLLGGLSNNSSTNLDITAYTDQTKKFVMYDANGEHKVFDTYADYAGDLYNVPSHATYHEITDADGSTHLIPGNYGLVQIYPENVQTYSQWLAEKNKDAKTRSKKVTVKNTVTENKIEKKKEEVKKTQEDNSTGDTSSVPTVTVELTEADKAEIEKITKTVLQLEGTKANAKKFGLKPADIQKQIDTLLERKRTLESNVNNSPRVMSDDEVDTMEKLEGNDKVKLPGISLSQKNHVVNYLFNMVAERVGYEKGVATSKAVILGNLRNIFKSKIEIAISEIDSQIDLYTELEQGFMVDILTAKREDYKNLYSKLPEIEDEVLALLEERMDIKSVKSGSKKTNIDSTTTENVVEEEAPAEASELDDIPQRDTHFNSSSLEVKGKATVSAKMKRFFAGIPKNSMDGNPKVGFLGLEEFYDFKELDNLIKVGLNEPLEIDSDFELVKLKLKELAETQPWAKAVYDRLTDVNLPEQTKMEFMYNYTGRHAISSRFVEFENRGGRFYTKVMTANFTDMSKRVFKTWKDSVKSSDLYTLDEESGEYIVDREAIDRYIAEYDSILKELSVGNTVEIPMNYLPQSTWSFFQGNSEENEIVLSQDLLKEKNFNKFSKIADNGELFKPTGLNVSFKVSRVPTGLVFTRVEVGYNTMAKLNNWLTSLGLDVNSKTITDLVTGGLDVSRTKKLSFNNMLDKSNLASPLSVIYDNLKKMKSASKDNKLSLEDHNILNGASDSFTALARVEAKNTDSVVTKDFRDNGKLIQGLPIAKFATDRVKDLVLNSNNILETLGNLSFNQSSMILHLLKDENFKGIFRLHHTANGTFKEKDSKFDKDSKSTDLTAIDLEVAKLGYFFNVEGAPSYNATSSIPQFSGKSDTRVANVFLPTMSDKDQSLMLQTLIFNITTADYENGQFSDRMLDLLYTQLVLPDLKRMVKAANRKGGTDIKGYDKASHLFNLLSSFNELTVPEEGNRRLIDLIKNNPEVYNLDKIDVEFKDILKGELNNLMNSLVDSKLDTWNKLEIIKGQTIKVDQKYIDERVDRNAGPEVLHRNLAAEFVINNLMTNANAHMLIIGDPALYSQDKFFKKGFTNGDPTKAEDTGMYKKWAKTSQGINLGKRLALMLAPGNKLYNSQNETYHQIFMKDYVSISTNILDLVETEFGKEARNNLAIDLEKIEEYNKTLSTKDVDPEVLKKASEDKDALMKKIKGAYSTLADYFEIEGTDAQEYTTVAEHINVMRKQGRIDDAKYNNIVEKLNNQVAESQKGLPISESNMLTYDEIKFVLQPMKPVYTGQVFDEVQDVMRTVYVKSSSFPLIPQLTQGKEIDKLRQVMEQYEASINPGKDIRQSWKGVRASYDTANKVGATKNAIAPFTPDGKFNPDFNLETIGKATLELHRKNFRIQQDVPYKSGKGKEDRVSLGTQMLKILFSNGLSDIEDQIFLNPDWNHEKFTEGKGPMSKYISGEKLFSEYNQAFTDLVEAKTLELYRELGLNSNGSEFVGEGNSFSEFKIRLSKLLDKEGRKRDYSKNDLDSFKLDEHGNFSIPLFMNNQSNKIESLLLSIISNRVIHHKLPGYSYVAASEAGFQAVEDIENIPGRDRIIYSRDYVGHLRGARNTEGQEADFAEVMIPSKLRDNKGELLDLYQKDKKGEYKYIEVVDGKFQLKYIKNSKGEEVPMIQEHLFNLPSFRIPSSSHVSLSNIKVVGILPPEAGDMIFVPKNFTKQKGLDFDVDKENTYHLWTYVDPHGRVKELSQGYIDYLVDKLKNKRESEIERLKEEDPELYEELLSAVGEDGIDQMIVSSRVKDKEATEEAPKEDTEGDSTEDKPKKKPGKIIGLDYIEEFENRMKIKLLENKFIKINTSVLGSNDPRVKSKINKILSMDFASTQAEQITKLKEMGEYNNFKKDYMITNPNATEKEVQDAFNDLDKNFTILSDDYQSYKLFLGSAGKSGIGVYSNFLTMSGLLQQYGKGRAFIRETVEDAVGRRKTKTIEFDLPGIGTVTGQLGSLKTIDGSRSISDVFEELQNTATDNEKEQIMGRTGINNHTIAVFSIMTALGIDKTNVSNSVAKELGLTTGDTDVKMSFGNLILSQDVVTKIVEQLEYNNSTVTAYDNKRVIDILTDRINKLSGELEVSPHHRDFSSLTGDNLVKSLAGDTSGMDTDLFEYQLLNFLKVMYEQQDSFRNAQKVMNISSKGLGLDLVEANNLVTLTENVVSNKHLTGIASTMFDVVKQDVNTETGVIQNMLYDNDLKRTRPLTEEEQAKVLYISSKLSVIPRTPIGASVARGLNLSNQLWSREFHYDNPAYKAALEQALDIAGIVGNSKAKLDFEKDFNKAYKKYILSANPTNEKSIKAERERLFFDTRTNISLASYMESLMSDSTANQELLDEDTKEIVRNPLTKKFSFNINKNLSNNRKVARKPSTIAYNDANYITESTEGIYRAIPDMIEQDLPLPPFNGDEEYSTRKLAQDLISYAFAEGGVQEFRQFMKFVPVSYLRSMGIAQEVTENYGNTRNFVTGSEGSTTGTTKFVRQFFQHNPDKLPKFTQTVRGTTLKALIDNEKFNPISDTSLIRYSYLTQDQMALPFLSVKYKSSRGEYFMFENDVANQVFRKVPILGFPGLSEYDMDAKESVTSLAFSPASQGDTDINEVPSDLPGDSTVTLKKDLSSFKGVSQDGDGATASETVDDLEFTGSEDGTDFYSGFEDYDDIDLDPDNYSPVVLDSGLPIQDSYSADLIDDIIDRGGEFSELLREYRESIPHDIKVVVSDKLAVNGAYDKNTNTIYISSRIIESSKAQRDAIITKELIHAMTNRVVSTYLKYDGSYKDGITPEQVPLPVRKLKVIFDTLRSNSNTIYNKNGVSLKEFLENFRKGGALTKTNFETFYGLTDIHEFMEMAMTEPAFREFLDSVSERGDKRTFMDRIRQAMKDLMSFVLPADKKLSQEVTDQVEKIIFSSRIYNQVSSTEDLRKSFTQNFSDLNEVKDLLDNLLNGNFASQEVKENPFKC